MVAYVLMFYNTQLYTYSIHTVQLDMPHFKQCWKSKLICVNYSQDKGSMKMIALTKQDNSQVSLQLL